MKHGPRPDHSRRAPTTPIPVTIHTQTATADDRGSGSSSGKAAFADFAMPHVLMPELRPGPGTPWAITEAETRCGIKIDALLPGGHEPPTASDQ
ncbi:MAG: hypothetical protein FWH55_01250 [Oscillospiraceae bacterium]|nr:hypothetical protein [Oscillospiraceae bacterium]